MKEINYTVNFITSNKVVIDFLGYKHDIIKISNIIKAMKEEYLYYPTISMLDITIKNLFTNILILDFKFPYNFCTKLSLTNFEIVKLINYDLEPYTCTLTLKEKGYIKKLIGCIPNISNTNYKTISFSNTSYNIVIDYKKSEMSISPYYICKNYLFGITI